MAYAYHYRSLDSVKLYAERVLETDPAPDMRYEAYNNLAFYYIGKMHYREADTILSLIQQKSDNHIELAIASVQQMRLCQRESRNKDFYTYRQKALKHIRRVHEEKNFSERQRRRIGYAETECRLVTSVYDYYVGRIEESVSQLNELDSLNTIYKDTVQVLAYLYNIGAGGVLKQGTKEYISHLEYDYLMQCYVMAEENGYTYWKANAMQALAEHIINDKGHYFSERKMLSLYLNTEGVADSLLSGNIAQRAQSLFAQYGDIYQEAATWRTLSRCYGMLNDFSGAVYALQKAEEVSIRLLQAPALMASIYELYSKAFSALDKKSLSDYYRNKYLDLYDNTRQDRELEARAENLDSKIKRLNILIYVNLAIILLLSAVLTFLVVKRMKRRRAGKESVSNTFRKLKDENDAVIERLEEGIEEDGEQCAMKGLQLERQQEYFLEQRAKTHLILTLTPLLDRMLHEVEKMEQENKTQEDSITEQENKAQEESTARRKEYVRELLQRINDENAFLTRWIQMKQGELSLRIETFELQRLFDVVKKNAGAFAQKGVTLNVEDTAETVKADSILTLFMINTLCDNARKHTSQGDTVTVSAKTTDEMIEISIADTGEGMSEEQRLHAFDAGRVADESIETTTAVIASQSHGFGLPNCKGIIEKYKKTNALFRQCAIGITSEKGHGTTVSFRLPRGKKIFAVMTLLLTLVTGAKANIVSIADSVYQCNVSGRYQDAITHAELCLTEINRQYVSHGGMPEDTLQLCDTLATEIADVRWLHNGVAAPYPIILSLRNEVAVAALALHDWTLYHYNNNAYSQLFKDYSSDKNLAEYCRKMERTETDSSVAICLLVFLILLFIPIYYFAYYKHIISDTMTMLKKTGEAIEEKKMQREALRERLSRITFEHDRLHVANNIMANSLSTIKHETMYYPSRIMQLLEEGDTQQLKEVAVYYRIIYHTLSRQAQHNSRNILPPYAIRDIMMRLMAKVAGIRKSELQGERNGNYRIFRLPLDKVRRKKDYGRMLMAEDRTNAVEAADARNLAEPTERNKTKDNDTQEISARILTQAARDLGEIYGLRRCGIAVEGDKLVVTVPEQIFCQKQI